jgi:hypothetical protein
LRFAGDENRPQIPEKFRESVATLGADVETDFAVDAGV